MYELKATTVTAGSPWTSSCRQVRAGSVPAMWLNVGMLSASSAQVDQDLQIGVTAAAP